MVEAQPRQVRVQLLQALVERVAALVSMDLEFDAFFLDGGLAVGERFRAVLATLLLAQPPPQLLVLDEPTNNLDLASVRQLETALRGYRCGLVLVSHDDPFGMSIGITRRLRLDRSGQLFDG